MIQTAIKVHILWWTGACHLCIVPQRNGYCDVMEVLISYCHSKGYIKHQSIGYCMWCKPKYYNRGYVHFCVLWILEVFTNDPCAGTTNDCICCLHWLSVHVGICSIHRPWFSQGLTGCGALPSHLKMGAASTVSSTTVYCMVPGCKGGALIWQVDTKRNNSKIFPKLLV